VTFWVFLLPTSTHKSRTNRQEIRNSRIKIKKTRKKLFFLLKTVTFSKYINSISIYTLLCPVIDIYSQDIITHTHIYTQIKLQPKPVNEPRLECVNFSPQPTSFPCCCCGYLYHSTPHSSQHDDATRFRFVPFVPRLFSSFSRAFLAPCFANYNY